MKSGDCPLQESVLSRLRPGAAPSSRLSFLSEVARGRTDVAAPVQAAVRIPEAGGGGVKREGKKEEREEPKKAGRGGAARGDGGRAELLNGGGAPEGNGGGAARAVERRERWSKGRGRRRKPRPGAEVEPWRKME